MNSTSTSTKGAGGDASNETRGGAISSTGVVVIKRRNRHLSRDVSQRDASMIKSPNSGSQHHCHHRRVGERLSLCTGRHSLASVGEGGEEDEEEGSCCRNADHGNGSSFRSPTGCSSLHQPLVAAADKTDGSSSPPTTTSAGTNDHSRHNTLSNTATTPNNNNNNNNNSNHSNHSNHNNHHRHHNSSIPNKDNHTVVIHERVPSTVGASSCNAIAASPPLFHSARARPRGSGGSRWTGGGGGVRVIGSSSGGGGGLSTPNSPNHCSLSSPSRGESSTVTGRTVTTITTIITTSSSGSGIESERQEGMAGSRSGGTGERSGHTSTSSTMKDSSLLSTAHPLKRATSTTTLSNAHQPTVRKTLSSQHAGNTTTTTTTNNNNNNSNDNTMGNHHLVSVEPRHSTPSAALIFSLEEVGNSVPPALLLLTSDPVQGSGNGSGGGGGVAKPAGATWGSKPTPPPSWQKVSDVMWCGKNSNTSGQTITDGGDGGCTTLSSSSFLGIGGGGSPGESKEKDSNSPEGGPRIGSSSSGVTGAGAADPNLKDHDFPKWLEDSGMLPTTTTTTAAGMTDMDDPVRVSHHPAAMSIPITTTTASTCVPPQHHSDRRLATDTLPPSGLVSTQNNSNNSGPPIVTASVSSRCSTRNHRPPPLPYPSNAIDERHNGSGSLPVMGPAPCDSICSSRSISVGGGELTPVTTGEGRGSGWGWLSPVDGKSSGKSSPIQDRRQPPHLLLSSYHPGGGGGGSAGSSYAARHGMPQPLVGFPQFGTISSCLTSPRLSPGSSVQSTSPFFVFPSSFAEGNMPRSDSPGALPLPQHPCEDTTTSLKPPPNILQRTTSYCDGEDRGGGFFSSPKLDAPFPSGRSLVVPASQIPRVGAMAEDVDSVRVTQSSSERTTPSTTTAAAGFSHQHHHYRRLDSGGLFEGGTGGMASPASSSVSPIPPVGYRGIHEIFPDLPDTVFLTRERIFVPETAASKLGKGQFGDVLLGELYPPIEMSDQLSVFSPSASNVHVLIPAEPAMDSAANSRLTTPHRSRATTVGADGADTGNEMLPVHQQRYTGSTKAFYHSGVSLNGSLLLSQSFSATNLAEAATALATPKPASTPGTNRRGGGGGGMALTDDCVLQGDRDDSHHPPLPPAQHPSHHPLQPPAPPYHQPVAPSASSQAKPQLGVDVGGGGGAAEEEEDLLNVSLHSCTSYSEGYEPLGEPTPLRHKELRDGSVARHRASSYDSFSSVRYVDGNNPLINDIASVSAEMCRVRSSSPSCAAFSPLGDSQNRRFDPSIVRNSIGKREMTSGLCSAGSGIVLHSSKGALNGLLVEDLDEEAKVVTGLEDMASYREVLMKATTKRVPSSREWGALIGGGAETHGGTHNAMPTTSTPPSPPILHSVPGAPTAERLLLGVKPGSGGSGASGGGTLVLDNRPSFSSPTDQSRPHSCHSACSSAGQPPHTTLTPPLLHGPWGNTTLTVSETSIVSGGGPQGLLPSSPTMTMVGDAAGSSSISPQTKPSGVHSLPTTNHDTNGSVGDFFERLFTSTARDPLHFGGASGCLPLPCKLSPVPEGSAGAISPPSRSPQQMPMQQQGRPRGANQGRPMNGGGGGPLRLHGAGCGPPLQYHPPSPATSSIERSADSAQTSSTMGGGGGIEPSTTSSAIPSTAGGTTESGEADGPGVAFALPFRSVAVKNVCKADLNHPKRWQALLNEITMASHLCHKALVNWFGVAEDHADVLLVMDLAEKGNLEQYIVKFGVKHTREMAARFMADVVLALEYLQDGRQHPYYPGRKYGAAPSLDDTIGGGGGADQTLYPGHWLESDGETDDASIVLHRDLKPENLLLTWDYHIKIADFGSACFLGDVAANRFAGTAPYLSPEMISESKAGRYSDLWASGCILYQMLEGRGPFNEKTDYFSMQKIKRYETGSLAFSSEVSSDAVDLVEQLLQRNPVDRLGAVERGGFAALKRHAFFGGIDWENVLDGSNLTTTNAEYDVTNLSQHIAPQDVVLYNALVVPLDDQRFKTPVLLILTDAPRLFIVDPQTNEHILDLHWSRRMQVVVECAETFRLEENGHTVYRFRDECRRADLWAERIAIVSGRKRTKSSKHKRNKRRTFHKRKM